MLYQTDLVLVSYLNCAFSAVFGITLLFAGLLELFFAETDPCKNSYEYKLLNKNEREGGLILVLIGLICMGVGLYFIYAIIVLLALGGLYLIFVSLYRYLFT